MISRKLDHCSLNLLACLVEFEEQLRGHGIAFVRACTYRSREEQNALYAQGRTSPGRIVTFAKGGQSPHNDTHLSEPASNAADYYPLMNGKLCGDQTDTELALWSEMGKIAVQCGLEWGGNWQARKRDRPHVQLPKEKR